MLSKKNNPLVSICIANYNGEKIVNHCIESVIKQKTNVLFEVIVHDDASNDDSVNIINKYEGISLLVSNKNVGYCESNNKMASIARGEYILLLNNDAELLPDAIQSLAELSSLFPNDILTLPQYSFEDHSLLDTGMLLDIFCNPVPIQESASSVRAMAMGSCLWIPRSTWNASKGLPIWFKSMAEDMYICFFTQIMGNHVRCLSKSGYLHRVGYSFGGGKVINNGLSSTFKRRSLSERNKTFIMLIFYPKMLLSLIIPLHIISLMMECAVLCVHKRSTKPFREIYMKIATDTIQNKNNIIQERLLVKSVKSASFLSILPVFTIIPYKLKMLIKHGLPKLK